MKLRLLDLFSGIGAYSLGLERTGGFEPVAFCEINPYCRQVLARHWPCVTIYEDVCDVSAARLRHDGIVPDWIVAGWPCQGNSPAGTGLGMDDPRSGLWAEIARLASELRPCGLLLENSSNLLSINGGADFGRVLGDLAALGYDAEWHCLPAAAFDAPHIRDRVWIIATLADADGAGVLGLRGAGGIPPQEPVAIGPGDGGPAADAEIIGRDAGRLPVRAPQEHAESRSAHQDATSHADRLAPVGTAIARAERVSWEPEPDVGRVVHGAANRVERIHALGNLNPPIIPETIGRAILEALQSEQAAA